MQKSPRNVHHQRGQGGGAGATRRSAAGLGTYELIMGAALDVGSYDGVLAQADAARAALRESTASSSGEGGGGDDAVIWWWS